MATKQKPLKFVTPVGELLYPYLDKPEEWKGKSTGNLSAQIKMSEANVKEFTKKMYAGLKKASESGDLRGKKWLKAPKIGNRLDKNGDVLFKFKTKEVFTTKDGDVKRVIPVFDAKGKPMVGIKIGHGSTVKIAITAIPYWEDEEDNGFRVYLDAIQVIELKEYGAGDASGFGFDKEDGYEAEETGAEVFLDDEIPTEDDEDNSGDF